MYYLITLIVLIIRNQNLGAEELCAVALDSAVQLEVVRMQLPALLPSSLIGSFGLVSAIFDHGVAIGGMSTASWSITIFGEVTLTSALRFGWTICDPRF